jgi:DNA-directed RNA polymerase subunit RPC12/RpoP
MKTALAKTSTTSSDKLVCPACGSRERFIEVMESEAHLVDGNRNYIRLIEGVTDHYICCACDESFESNIY